MKVKCCMESCNNEVDTKIAFEWYKDDKGNPGYACESCLDQIGDE